MDPQLLQLVGSLIAILVLAAIAWGLGLGKAAGIKDAEHAMALAREADTGFEPAEAAISHDGTAAIIADSDGRIMVLRGHGVQFAGRVLDAGATARCEGSLLTVMPADPRYGPVALDLGDDAQAWAARVEALHGAGNA